mmetsp:Transcript_17776/g.35509  ORF Transcript_17776/g.35509 Transcript_17776/m.35509 type:complete len:93 (-) Transcript_17776:205-483(-)
MSSSIPIPLISLQLSCITLCPLCTISKSTKVYTNLIFSSILVPLVKAINREEIQKNQSDHSDPYQTNETKSPLRLLFEHLTILCVWGCQNSL